ncbi:lipopolysaccharide biosynthesis protein [Humibacter sp.]|uniref:lipopolysaccharide biosynthesis protein n=1 Tax=Humibacter sp. TaxID=1940291 RepID=UPI002D805F95|nr:lipopolysaccharide biosynthesis protein [Humibacter sp.]
MSTDPAGDDPSGSRGEPLSARELQHRAISGSLWTALHVVVSVPIAFVANAVIARTLGVTKYGGLAFVTATLAVVAGAANLGVTTATIQFGSQAEAQGDRARTDRLLRSMTGYQLMLELPVLIVVIAALTRHHSLWILAILVVGEVLSVGFAAATATLSIENRVASSARVAIVANVFMQTGSVAVATITHSPTAVWATRILLLGLQTPFSWILLDRKRKSLVLHPRLPRGLGRAYWRFGLYACGAGLVGMLVFSRSEIFILRALDRTHALGIFALAFGISQQITAPADAMLNALIPATAGLLSRSPEMAAGALARAIRVSATVVGLITATALPALIFAIPAIYGHQYSTAAWALLPLALVSCFQTVNNPVGAFMSARLRSDLVLRTNLVALGTDAVLAFGLIPPFGLWGAIAANAGAQLVSVIVLAAIEARQSNLGVAGLVRCFLPFAVGVAAMGLSVGSGVAARSAGGATAGVVCSVLVGALAFTVGLRLTREGLQESDRAAIDRALSGPLRRLAKRPLDLLSSRSRVVA